MIFLTQHIKLYVLGDGFVTRILVLLESVNKIYHANNKFSKKSTKKLKTKVRF